MVYSGEPLERDERFVSVAEKSLTVTFLQEIQTAEAWQKFMKAVF